MKEAVVAIISAVFNIVAIVLKATGFSTAADVLYQVMPEVNIIAVSVLWFFGYQAKANRLSHGVPYTECTRQDAVTVAEKV